MNTPTFSLLGFDDHTSIMLQDMHQACTLAGAWDWIKTFNEESFMFSSHPMIGEISKHMKYDGHSGASFGLCMRHMENYAKHGAEAYAWKYAKNEHLRATFLREVTDCECKRVGRAVAAGRSFTGGPRDWEIYPCACKTAV
jgi:hypothetical protein